MGAPVDTSGAEAALERVRLLSSFPASRGFAIRSAASPNACLTLSNGTATLLPHAGGDAHQRWIRSNGYLKNLAANLCLDHNGYTGPVTADACAKVNFDRDALWLGPGGDTPSYVPLPSNVTPYLYGGASSTDPNAVFLATTTLPTRFWQFGHAPGR